jgi:hypothetical protein
MLAKEPESACEISIAVGTNGEAMSVRRSIQGTRSVLHLLKAAENRLSGRRGEDSPKVLRFSIDINSSVPGSLGAGVFGIVVR